MTKNKLIDACINKFGEKKAVTMEGKMKT